MINRVGQIWLSTEYKTVFLIIRSEIMTVSFYEEKRYGACANMTTSHWIRHIDGSQQINPDHSSVETGWETWGEADYLERIL